MNKHQVSTAMRTAFENIKVKQSAFSEEGKRIGGIVVDAINGKAGIYKRNDWNAHLSFRTAGLLNAPAFNIDRHYGKNNAFDCMVG
jgi:glutamate-1-semialdehyde aminotransferase